MIDHDDPPKMQLVRSAFDPAGLTNPVKSFTTPPSCGTSARQCTCIAIHRPELAAMEVC
jgi:glycolate oxidase